jgi:hypothetical protein
VQRERYGADNHRLNSRMTTRQLRMPALWQQQLFLPWAKEGLG